MTHRTLFVVLLLCLGAMNIQAQSTFNQVYNILQTKCAALSCHGGVSAISFNVDGSETDVYNALVGKPVLNPAAKTAGNMLVAPGQPHKSFLLRKVAHGLSEDLELVQPNEGEDMPKNAPALSNVEVELIRQWIMFGAPQNDTVIDVAVLEDFYVNGKGLTSIDKPLTPAEEGKEGIQLKIGPVFLAPQQEIEYFYQYLPELEEDVDVFAMEATMNWESHHFVVYDKDTAANFDFGFVDGTVTFNQAAVHFSSEIMGIWQFDNLVELPQGTAFKWEKNTDVLLNYHIKNYNNDSVLAANAYLNVYTRPADPLTEQMHMDLITYGGQNPFVLAIPPTGGQVHTEEYDFTLPGKTWYVWSMQSHTHSLGTDFDIFLNKSGAPKEQIYEGFYNTDYTFDQGFFDYTHPAVRKFEPLLEVDMDLGFNLVADWVNNKPDTVRFGYTTNDEMFIAYMHYTEKLPSGIFGPAQVLENGLTIMPNPTSGRVTFSYELTTAETVSMELYDIAGKQVDVIQSPATQQPGSHRISYDLDAAAVTPGIYIIRQQVGDLYSTGKLVVTQ